jgi:hypothetical protein
VDHPQPAGRRATSTNEEAVNRHLILRNWLIGAYLVEFEQNGEDRTEYGAGLLKRIATDLRQRGMPGCAVRMLERMRVFYLNCPQLREMISSPAVTNSPETRATPRPLSTEMLLRLSWTHLIDLLAIEDPWKRAFYENECLKGNWAKRADHAGFLVTAYQTDAIKEGEQIWSR